MKTLLALLLVSTPAFALPSQLVCTGTDGTVVNVDLAGHKCGVQGGATYDIPYGLGDIVYVYPLFTEGSDQAIDGAQLSVNSFPNTLGSQNPHVYSASLTLDGISTELSCQ